MGIRPGLGPLLLCLALLTGSVTGPAGARAAAGDVKAEAPMAESAEGGIVEGFYGRPWTDEERRDTFVWMGSHGLTTYLYTPKDEPLLRRNWRDPWSATDLRRFEGLTRDAAASGVRLIPTISPGAPVLTRPAEQGGPPSAPICGACDADLDVVVDKFRPFADAGARSFALAFDDAWKTTATAEDFARYGLGELGAGRMHRDIANRLRQRLADHVGEDVDLVLVLADYAGLADTAYLRGVRAGGGLDDGIAATWVGNEVVSRRITADDTRRYAGLVGGAPIVIWDNIPVNDFTGPAIGLAPTRVFLSPYAGRDPELAGAAVAVLANPSSEVRASRVALGGLASWVADPRGHDAAAAWRHAIEDLAGGDAALVDAVSALAENSRSSLLDATESVAFGAAADALLAAHGGTDWPVTHRPFVSEVDRERQAPATIEERDPDLAAELGPWLAALRLNADAACAGAAALASTKAAVEASIDADTGTLSGRVLAPHPATVWAAFQTLSRRQASAAGQGVSVHGDRFGLLPGAGAMGRNRVDAFVVAVWQRVVPWLVRSIFVPRPTVVVTVDGARVPLASGGRFTTNTDGSARIEVADSHGGRTGVSVTPSAPATAPGCTPSSP